MVKKVLQRYIYVRIGYANKILSKLLLSKLLKLLNTKEYK